MRSSVGGVVQHVRIAGKMLYNKFSRLRTCCTTSTTCEPARWWLVGYIENVKFQRLNFAKNDAFELEKIVGRLTVSYDISSFDNGQVRNC